MIVTNFFYEIIHKDSRLSGKDFIALCSFGIIAICCIANLFWKFTLAEYMFWGLITLITTCLGIGGALAVKSMGVKSDVSQEMIKSEPKPETAQDAKDVMNSTKP